MAEPKDGGKRQASFYIEGELINRLDKWLHDQKEQRGYDIDRSHVVNVLLRRFLNANEPEKKERLADPSDQ